jgi:hypothetical protein
MKGGLLLMRHWLLTHAIRLDKVRVVIETENLATMRSIERQLKREHEPGSWLPVEYPNGCRFVLAGIDVDVRSLRKEES